MNKKQLLTLVIVYLLSLSAILTVFFVILSHLPRENSSEEALETEWIYVYWEKEKDSESETTPSGWIVKDYDGQVAIFTKDGTLLRILATYTKTLPEADRRLLREGIPIESESELYAIIEDYTE